MKEQSFGGKENHDKKLGIGIRTVYHISFIIAPECFVLAISVDWLLFGMQRLMQFTTSFKNSSSYTHSVLYNEMCCSSCNMYISCTVRVQLPFLLVVKGVSL